MQISVRHGKGKPGTSGEVARLVQEEFIPTIKKIPGFVAYYVVDIGDDRLLTISIFETEEGEVEAIRLAQAMVRERLADLTAAPVEVMSGKVVAQA